MHFPRALLFSLQSLLLCAAQIPRLTPAAAGPYHVSGKRILDAAGRPYLARGTELPTLTLNPSDIAGHISANGQIVMPKPSWTALLTANALLKSSARPIISNCW